MVRTPGGAGPWLLPPTVTHHWFLLFSGHRASRLRRIIRQSWQRWAGATRPATLILLRIIRHGERRLLIPTACRIGRSIPLRPCLLRMLVLLRRVQELRWGAASVLVPVRLSPGVCLILTVLQVEIEVSLHRGRLVIVIRR